MKQKQLVIFSVILGVLGLTLWIHIGKEWNYFDMFFKEIFQNLNQPIAILILQLIVIVSVTRVFGFFCTKIWQPSVIGQIIAGIVLGPSLIGYFFPGFSNFLFSPDSLKLIKPLSDLGLIFYMFIVGMELDIIGLKHKARQALIISTAGTIVPFVLGLILSIFLYKSFAPATVTIIPFSLFIGIAMCITAFPVLARILQERKMTKTHVGTVTLISAATGDITAWCMLVVIIAIATAGSIYAALLTIVLSVGYVLFMFKVLRPIVKYSEAYLADKTLHETVVAFIFVIMLASAYVTHVIGIHTLFGAFMAGVIMPHKINFKKNFTEKIEDVSLVLLLPLFFVFSGLHTDINLLKWNEWLICFGIILVAILGKFGACFIAARIIGENWKDSLSIGVLMNTRGMMELIVLNIGYDLGILKPEIFSILVLMALGTTFLTSPALEWIQRIFKDNREG